MDILLLVGILWMLVVALFVFGKKSHLMEFVIKRKNKSVFRESEADRNNIIDRGDIKVKLEFDRDNEINPEELYHFIEDIEAVIERNRKKQFTERLDKKKENEKDVLLIKESDALKEEETELNKYIKINQLK
ncbi:MAG: hypothetical protein CVT95_07845 [Bacteroidetes bacterium HGW-Bacteroidetes-12]|jgi:hypothetical protein|nr:MAG: hypothetical protein CVT95_07845 [Bacteroidetes bacterium HGW-Bacteroidetes-12]